MHELGDVLWYLNAIAVELGRSLDDVARLHRDWARRRDAGTVTGD